MDKAKMKKTGKIILDTLQYFFLVLCILSVIITLSSNRDQDGAAEVFGYQMRVVASDSMAKCELTDVSDFEIKDIPLRSMVFVKVIPDDPAEAEAFYRDLEVGDVLTFRYVYTTQVTITHRITSIEEKDTGGFIIRLAGDNKNSEDGQLEQVIDTSVPNNTNYVIGKVTGQSKLFGFVMSFLMQKIAIVLIIIVPCAAIILFEILKITKVLGADKKEREREEREQQERELNELRRKLAELEKQRAGQAAAADTADNEEPKEDKTE